MTASRLRTTVRRCGVAALMASIAVSAVPLVAGYWWVFDLLTHFRMQLIGGQLVLAALLVVTATPRWAAIAVLGASVNAYSVGEYLVPAAGGTGAGTAGSGPAVDVMTVNVRGGDRDLSALVRAIETESPDLIVIQEYQHRSARRLEGIAAVYRHRVELARSDAWGIALYSKLPITDAETLALGRTHAIDARVDVGGVVVRVLGVHLSSPMTRASAAARDAELVELAARVTAEELPMIVAGDFNVSPYSPRFGHLIAETGLRNVLAGRGPGITWPTFLRILGIPIDHCLVSSHWQVTGYRRLDAFGSDHYPIVVELKLQSFA